MVGELAMRYKLLPFFVISLISFFSLSVTFVTFAEGTTSETHVYYGYAPPSSDIYNVQESINGKMVNFSVPPGRALLDVVGLQDDTTVSLYDLFSGVIINSTTINRLQKVTFFIPYGTYFKLMTSHRVAAVLSGGSSAYSSGSSGGFSTFYPSENGGFRGKSFIFMTVPGSEMYAYRTEVMTHNLNVFALEDTHVRLADFTGKFSTSESLKQREVSRYLLQTRLLTLSVSSGAGYDIRYVLEASDDVMCASLSRDQVLYVPAITGGYVGKLFWAPDAAREPEVGRSAVLLIVPLEPGKVTIYDNKLNVLAERTFSSVDISTNSYWFKDFGLGIFDFIIKSTGNITVLAAQTSQNVSEDFIGTGITFLGARPNQEIKFFTPFSAIIFSTQDQTLAIDGQTRELRRDEVVTLGSGLHSLRGTGVSIIEIIAPGPGSLWKYGSYLIEPLDVTKSYEPIESLTVMSTPLTTYLVIGGVIVIVLVYFFILRKKKVKV
ncbi:MAG: hypothetical protein ACP5IT_10230 [Thermoproteota archaeon]